MPSSLKVIGACVGGSVLVVLAYRKVEQYITDRNIKHRFEEKCKEWPKDIVILHGMKRGRLSPSPSPFVIKLETFLRMHKISYIFECEFPKGDKQKMPWITLNGEHYTDSQLIIDFLSKKFSVKDSVKDKNLQGIATMARIMMDEHFFWGLLLWRYVYANGDHLDKIFNLSPSELKAFQNITYSKYREFSWCQGIGRHSVAEVIKIMKDDLRAISLVIGSKPFLVGDEPCNDDCAVFGQLAQFIWNDTKSPYTKLIEEELPNLKEYCIRMKERYWQDWDDIIKAGLSVS